MNSRRDGGYRAQLRRATPPWYVRGSWHRIKERARRMGPDVEVDHVVPLCSPLVCGLHCEANWRIVPRHFNQRKRNTWWPDAPVAQLDLFAGEEFADGQIPLPVLG